MNYMFIFAWFLLFICFIPHGPLHQRLNQETDTSTSRHLLTVTNKVRVFDVYGNEKKEVTHDWKETQWSCRHIINTYSHLADWPNNRGTCVVYPGYPIPWPGYTITETDYSRRGYGIFSTKTRQWSQFTTSNGNQIDIYPQRDLVFQIKQNVISQTYTGNIFIDYPYLLTDSITNDIKRKYLRAIWKSEKTPVILSNFESSRREIQNTQMIQFELELQPLEVKVYFTKEEAMLSCPIPMPLLDQLTRKDYVSFSSNIAGRIYKEHNAEIDQIIDDKAFVGDTEKYFEKIPELDSGSFIGIGLIRWNEKAGTYDEEKMFRLSELSHIKRDDFLTKFDIHMEYVVGTIVFNIFCNWYEIGLVHSESGKPWLDREITRKLKQSANSLTNCAKLVAQLKKWDRTLSITPTSDIKCTYGTEEPLAKDDETKIRFQEDGFKITITGVEIHENALSSSLDLKDDVSKPKLTIGGEALGVTEETTVEWQFDGKQIYFLKTGEQKLYLFADDQLLTSGEDCHVLRIVTKEQKDELCPEPRAQPSACSFQVNADGSFYQEMFKGVIDSNKVWKPVDDVVVTIDGVIGYRMKASEETVFEGMLMKPPVQELQIFVEDFQRSITRKSYDIPNDITVEALKQIISANPQDVLTLSNIPLDDDQQISDAGISNEALLEVLRRVIFWNSKKSDGQLIFVESPGSASTKASYLSLEVSNVEETVWQFERKDGFDEIFMKTLQGQKLYLWLTNARTC